MSNALVYFTLDLARDVIAAGGAVTIENPAPRGDVTLPQVYLEAKAHHANLFRTRPVLDYAAETRSVEVVVPLCAFGAPMQKYIMLLASPDLAGGLAPINGIICEHANHKETAYGVTSTGRPAALDSGRYPYAFNVVLACVHRGLPIPAYSPVEAAAQERATTVPGYAASVFDPGWWALESEGDLSDAGDAEFAVLCGREVQTYAACIKLPRQQFSAFKAANRTRFSMGPAGQVMRHDVPKGYDEAAIHPECAKLWEAMVREYNSHEDCQTWVLRPAHECYDSGKTPIDCMWVYDCKVDSTTQSFQLWKARLVGRGDQMVYLRGYTTTYSGVVRHGTWRLYLALCALLGLVLTGADVSTAYLHAPLRDHVVWMRQPKGFVQKVDGKDALCRLQMAIYGLKQSAREWAITVISWLTTWGFKQCVSDRYLFVCVQGASTLLLLIWVDDIFMGHNDAGLRGRFMEAFKERFRVKDLGPLRQALGASVAQSVPEGWVTFSLEKYISDLGRRFDLFDNVAWADIPVPVAMAKECLRSTPTDAEVVATLDTYGVLVGSIVFIATFARPDVAFSAHFLSTFLIRPGPVHLRLARRVLGYLSRTRALAITYRRGGAKMSMSFSPLDNDKPDKTGLLHLQCDTDHGVARSITGWLVMLAGAAVSWAVRAQLLPSLSSSESELYGISTAVCDLLVTIQGLEEMLIVLTSPVTVLTDSRGARLLHLDESASARTRHVHRRWFFVRHHIDEGRIRVELIKGALNHSNFLTKAVGGAAFNADRAYALGIA